MPVALARRWEADGGVGLGEFLDTVVLSEEDAQAPAVTQVLGLTLHAAKGLEFDTVVIVVPTWGQRLVSTITGDDIERLVAALRQKSGIRGSRLSNRRINLVLQVVRLCLDGVVRRGWLEENPARTLENLREERREPDPFSLDEVPQFLKDGLRPSEQIELQWSDIDWSRNLICGRRGVSRLGEGETKTEGSVREVHMLPRVRRALKAQQAASEGRSAWVFPNERGGALNITNQAAARAAMTRCGGYHLVTG
jgi:integrase